MWCGLEVHLALPNDISSRFGRDWISHQLGTAPLSALIAITRNITKHFRKNCKHFTMSLFSGNMSGDIWPVIGFSKFDVYFQRVNLVGSCHMDIIWAQRVGRNRTVIGISTSNRGRKTGSKLQRTNASTGDLR